MQYSNKKGGPNGPPLNNLIIYCLIGFSAWMTP